MVLPTSSSQTRSRSGSESSLADDESEIVAAQLKHLRLRPSKEPLSEAHEDALDRRESEGVLLEPFGEGRDFASSAEFLSEWTVYEVGTFSQYQSRGSSLATTVNAKRVRERLAAGLVLDDDFKKSLIPEEMGHAKITRRCRHGVRKKSRSTGKRNAKTSTFVKCPARITADAVCDESGKWSFRTRNEVSYHNHKCTQSMLDSYGTSALLAYPELVNDVSGKLQAGASARNICDTIAANYGIVVTPKQVANLRRDRLGGQTAVTNLKLLLQRFAAFPGSRSLIVDDQYGQVCAVVMQTAAQREMFNMYGDNLILDWTHNTNNLGFYLGSLMVTSVSGHGVSVCDFLCVEQTEAMMATVFEFFVDITPGAVDKVQSIVIDKDYKEWRVLERVFVKSTILLCQFHALRWFAYVVTMRKYGLSVTMREGVLKILTAMVYAKTITAFDLLRADLDSMLHDVSPRFLAYVEDRWYNCKRMWSNCERAAVFSALNTTTNRIESGWNQVKKVLGKKLRIDLCVEAVFAYQTAVMRREIAIISKYQEKLILRAEVTRFMRAALAEVCDFAAGKVAQEWSRQLRHDVGSGAEYVCWQDGSRYMVTRGGVEAATYAVHDTLRSCTCEFSVAAALPCRHIIFVAQRVAKKTEFPPEAIHERWRMRNAFGSLKLLKASTAEVQTLRTALLLSDIVFSKLIEPDFLEPEGRGTTPFRRIAYRRLQRHVECDVIVFNDVEKRSIAEAEFEEVVQFLMTQSTPRFMQLASELRDLLSARLNKWRKEHNAAGDEQVSSAPIVEAVEAAKDIDEAVAAAVALGESFGGDANSSRRCVSAQHGCSTDSADAAVLDCAVILPTTVDEEAKESQASVAHVADAAEPDRAFIPPSTLDQGAKESDGSAAHAASNETAPAIDYSVLSDGYASPGSRSMDDLMLKMLPPDCDLDVPVPSPPFGPSPSPPKPPQTASVLFPCHDSAVNAPSSAVAERTTVPRDLSVLLNPIVDDEVRSVDDVSIDSRTMSSIMHRVADHQLRTDAPATKSSRGGKAPAKRTPITDLAAEWLRDVMESDYDSSAFQSDDDGNAAVSSSGNTTGTLSRRTLPSRVGKGQTKKQKTSGRDPAGRLAYTEQISRCPVELYRFSEALKHTRAIGTVSKLWDLYPTLFDDKSLLTLCPSASKLSFASELYRLNFRVTAAFLQVLKGALASPGHVSTWPSAYFGDNVVVDLTTPAHGRPVGFVTEQVVSIDSNLRGFSQSNVADLEDFMAIRALCDTYKADEQWMQKWSKLEGLDVPYLHDAIAQRGLPHGYGVTGAALGSIIAVFVSTSLNTIFRIRTDRLDLQMSIKTRDIVGFIARNARLNDCVLMYALRQFACDYDDVYVVDSLDAPTCCPRASLCSTQWVVFPRNFSQVHWGIIVVKMAPGGVCDVWVYDPLQGCYESNLTRAWDATCKPLLRAWASRDGFDVVAFPAVKVVRTASQHDGDSCGVYCIGITMDLISGVKFFSQLISSEGRQVTGEQRGQRIRELRIRILWRMLCDSIRVDDLDSEQTAFQTVALVQSTASDGTKTIIARTNMAKITRGRRTWRS